MPLIVRFRPGAEAAVRLLNGLPMGVYVQGRGLVVNEPAGWSQRELESYIVRRVGPYLISMSSIAYAAPPQMGRCNCWGRR